MLRMLYTCKSLARNCDAVERKNVCKLGSGRTGAGTRQRQRQASNHWTTSRLLSSPGEPNQRPLLVPTVTSGGYDGSGGCQPRPTGCSSAFVQGSRHGACCPPRAKSAGGPSACLCQCQSLPTGRSCRSRPALSRGETGKRRAAGRLASVVQS